MRTTTTISALLASGLLAAAAAGPATAADRTTVQLGGAGAKGLVAGQGRHVALSGATLRGSRLSLPVRGVAVRGGTATITHRGAWTVRAGKRSVRLTDVRLTVGSRSRLTARIGARRYTVATLFAPASVRRVTAVGAALDRAPATLTAAAARQLRTRLKLRRTPKGRLGTISVATGGVTVAGDPSAPAPTPSPIVPAPLPDLVVPPVPEVPDPPAEPGPVDPGPVDPGPVDPEQPRFNPYDPVDDSRLCATATRGLTAGEHLGSLPPAPPGAAAVEAGTTVWGFAAFLRGSFPAYDPDAAGSYNRQTGATCDEPFRAFAGEAYQRADDRFGLSVTDGWYDAATGTAAARLDGGFRIGYHIGGWAAYNPAGYVPGPYRGLWAAFVDAQLTLDGTTGTIAAYGDAGGNNPWRYVAGARRTFGALDLTGITPDGSVPGQVTWHDVPVTLTPEGEALGVGYFVAGDALDPITITLRTGS